MAGSAIDLNEVALPQLLDPCQVQRSFPRLRSPNVQGTLADLVNGDRAHTENSLARSPTVDKRQPMGRAVSSRYRRRAARREITAPGSSTANLGERPSIRSRLSAALAVDWLASPARDRPAGRVLVTCAPLLWQVNAPGQPSLTPPACPPCAARRNKWLRTKRGS
jgi:hypothetical protein